MRFLKGAILAISLLLASSPAFSEGRGWAWISPERAYNLLSEGSGMWFVDVRSQGQFEQEHIEGAVNISVLDLRYRDYPKSKLFVLVDGSPGLREAMEAAELLASKGHRSVYVLKGGVTGWRLEGLPTVSNSDEHKAVGVTAQELDWALKNNVSLKVFDLRDDGGGKPGAMPGSQMVPGASPSERMDNLRSILEKKPTQAERLSGPETVVLVFSGSEDAVQLTENVSFGLKKDVRYLLGGYEAYESLGKKGELKTSGTGQGQTCPQAR